MFLAVIRREYIKQIDKLCYTCIFHELGEKSKDVPICVIT